MAWFTGFSRDKAGNGAADARGALAELQESEALTRQAAAARTRAGAVTIDAASLAATGAWESEERPTATDLLDNFSLLRQSTKMLEAKLAQGLYAGRDKAFVEAELRRRQGWDQETHAMTELRRQIAGLEQRLRDKDVELRRGERWIRFFMVIAVIFVAAWLIEVVPPLWQILAAR